MRKRPAFFFFEPLLHRFAQSRLEDLMKALAIGVCLGGLIGLFAPKPLGAQTSDGPFGFVSGRAGINTQAVPDGVSGGSVGAGASVGAFVGSQWAIEFEAWIPEEIEDAGVRNKVLLFSGSAVRFFNDKRSGPYVLFGLTAAQIEFGSASDVSGGVQLGVGGAVRLSERTSVAPELRANVTDGGMFLFRPNVGFMYTFP
jgi:hypothetical protein